MAGINVIEEERFPAEGIRSSFFFIRFKVQKN